MCRCAGSDQDLRPSPSVMLKDVPNQGFLQFAPRPLGTDFGMFNINDSRDRKHEDKTTPTAKSTSNQPRPGSLSCYKPCSWQAHDQLLLVQGLRLRPPDWKIQFLKRKAVSSRASLVTLPPIQIFFISELQKAARFFHQSFFLTSFLEVKESNKICEAPTKGEKQEQRGTHSHSP